jgi:endonuclease I
MKNFVISAILMLVCSSSFAQGPNDSGTYYQNADGKKGAELKTALCGIIYNRTERTYGDLWTDFQKTDKRADGKVWDMYSNATNFEFGTHQDKGSGGSTEGEFYNREHSWPNSWFGGKIQPMYTDLYHIYPTDKLVNNKRGNNPFGETNGEFFKSKNDFSKLGACTYSGYTGTVFEPNDEYKGDFARTYFYMVTCYEEKIVDWYTTYGINNNDANKKDTKEAVMATLDGKTYPGLSAWQLEMLLKWAKNDPVSEKETNRNKAVYDIQKNRNPFIDYPGLEQYIWGDMKDQAFSYNNYVQPTGIGIIDVEADTTPTAIYSIDGRRLDQPQKGVNIMKIKDGKTKKIIKK